MVSSPRLLLRLLLCFLLDSFVYGQINPYSLPGQDFQFNYSNTHGDHMVLQSNVNASLWGFGTLFAPITITLTGGPENTTTNVTGYVSSTGVWKVKLPPQPPSTIAYRIYGESPYTNESFTIQDVLFGDVFICGGQSNMAYGMGSILNSTAELARSTNRPFMRIFSSQYSAQNFSQLQVVNEYAINWTIATPSSLPGFSAVCYLTAANVYDATNGSIPFGLIDTSVGGTAIQLWFPPLSFNDCSTTINPYDVYNWPWSASCWYNGMVSPFTVGPTDMKLFLWDQGENNVGERSFYECAFPTVVRTWREQFKTNAPFYFVQLPAYMRQADDWSLADFREGQVTAMGYEPNVGFISTVDAGDAYDGSIHNRDKSLIGYRLGNVVLSQVYNIPRPYLHPAYQSATAVTSGSTITVTITTGTTAAMYGGLVYVSPSFDSNATWCPTARGVNLTYCDWLMVQTNDSQTTWWNASSITIGGPYGAQITVTIDTSPQTNLLAVSTRNGYRDWPVTNIYNGAGLPLLPWTPKPIDTSYIVPSATQIRKNEMKNG